MKVESIKELLPAVMQRTVVPDSLMYGILAAMERLHESPDRIIQNYRDYLDPKKPYDGSFLTFMAQWLDLETLYAFTDPKAHETGPADGHSKRRGVFNRDFLANLVSNAMTLYALRGTTEGIVLALRLATGSGDFSIDSADASSIRGTDPFHFTVNAAASASSLNILIEKIIVLFKPAHSTFDLRYTNRLASGEKA